MNKCRYCRKETKEGATLCDSPLCKAKRELSEYRYKFQTAELLREEVDRLRERITSCSVSLETNVHTGKKDGFETQMAKYIDLKDRYEKLRSEAYEKALKVEYKIREMESPYGEILRMKYIKLWTFEKIAVELNYYYRHVIRLYNKALKIYSELQTWH